MITRTQPCKVCKRPLEVRYDDSDDFLKVITEKLIPSLCCDRCADYRQDRRKLYENIKGICERLAMGYIVTKEAKESAKETLRTLCCQYLRKMAEYRGAPVPDWEESIVETILEQPANFSKVVGQFPKLFRQQPALL